MEICKAMKVLKRTIPLTLLFLVLNLGFQRSALLRAAHAQWNTDSSEAAASSADWRMSGPSGGDVRALVIDPNDPNRFYFGTLDGQIYTSTDAAHNWHLLANLNRPRL